jgi:uncharacterized membrane protein YhhN
VVERASGGELHLMPWIAIALTIGCLLAASGLVVAESRNLGAAGVLSKVAASTTFVLLALSLHAAASTYGQLVLLALVLSWIGDVFLLGRRSVLFLSGLGSFLLAHVAFSVAFATGALSTSAFLVGLIFASAIGVITLRWLWGWLDAPYKVAVAAYVVAIVAMCTMAIAHSAASQSWLAAVGAVAFAASDISVARDRFVVSAFLNKAWGLPVYYSAQLLLAWSIT